MAENERSKNDAAPERVGPKHLREVACEPPSSLSERHGFKNDAAPRRVRHGHQREAACEAPASLSERHGSRRQENKQPCQAGIVLGKPTRPNN
jgi:hypothetical protein